MHRLLSALVFGGLLTACAAPTGGGTPEPAPGSSQDGGPALSIPIATPPPPSASDFHTVEVYLDLYDADAWTEDEVTCVGEDGYADVGPGMPIEVYNQDGDLLGETALASGFVLETGRCSFHVVIQNVPEAEVYVVSSPDRGELRFTRGDMAAADWIVTMSLGN